MKFKPMALALACGVFGALLLLVSTYYPVLFGLGQQWKELMMDLYPFYSDATWYHELSGVVLGFIDGFVGGLIIAWLYNAFAGKK